MDLLVSASVKVEIAYLVKQSEILISTDFNLKRVKVEEMEGRETPNRLHLR